MTEVRYPEKTIQEAMTAWLCRHWGFAPLFDDIEAAGARFDSIGTLNGRMVLIEYKVAVSESIVGHSPTRPMSLESKISGGLRNLYCDADDYASRAANASWDRARPPIVVVAAQRFSAASIAALNSMLMERSAQWHFDWALWRWTGHEVEVVMSGSTSERSSPVSYADIEVPHLIGRSVRGRARTLEELIHLASPGEGRVLSAFAEQAKNRGFRFLTGRTKLAILGRRQGKWVICAAAYVGAADGTTLNIGVDLNRAERPEALGALPTAAPAGFLNTNVRVECSADLATLFDALGNAQQ